MQYNIHVIPNSGWKPRFFSIYNQFKDQITKKIVIELETSRIIPSTSCNSIGIFTQPKRDKPQEARFQLDWIPRNLSTYKNKTLMTSMEQIEDFIGSRPFRSKLDLTDRYHNIRIYADLVSDLTFTCHMGKFDCLVMQQGECNAPATMMRGIDYLFREVKDHMIYLDNILIANHTYEEHINSIRQVLQIVKQNKLWFNRHKCQFMADELAILGDYLTELE